MISGRHKNRSGAGTANLFRRLPRALVLMAERHAEPYMFASEIKLECRALSGQPRGARDKFRDLAETAYETEHGEFCAHRHPNGSRLKRC